VPRGWDRRSAVQELTGRDRPGALRRAVLPGVGTGVGAGGELGDHPGQVRLYGAVQPGSEADPRHAEAGQFRQRRRVRGEQDVDGATDLQDQ
jgi:hypothetical protein